MLTCASPNNGWQVRRLPSMSIQCRLYFEQNIVWFDCVLSSEPDHVYEWPAPCRRAGDAINLNLTAIMDRTSPCDDKGHSMMMIYIPWILIRTIRRGWRYDIKCSGYIDQMVLQTLQRQFDRLRFVLMWFIKSVFEFSTSPYPQSGWQGGESSPSVYTELIVHLILHCVSVIPIPTVWISIK